jgi:RNA polymerase sigma-70 factor, ECF subfamily
MDGGVSRVSVYRPHSRTHANRNPATFPPPSDSRMVKGADAMDTREAWADVAAHEGDRLFRATRAVTVTDEAAWDCVQEAFLTALRGKGVAALDDPVAWLCGVARNHARNLRRTEVRRTRFLARFRRTASPAMPADPQDGLHRALARLPANLRDAVVLRYFARMSMRQIGTTQGVAEGTARSRVSRGLDRLRNILGAAVLLGLLVREASAATPDGAALIRDAREAPVLPSATSRMLVPIIIFVVALVAIVTVSALVEPEAPGRPGIQPRARADADGGGEDRKTTSTTETDSGDAVPGLVFAKSGPAVFRDDLRVLDLATGKPMAGFALCVVDGEGSSRRIEADSDGRITLPEDAQSAKAVDSEWTLTGTLRGTRKYREDLWVYRMVTVMGSVAGLERTDIDSTDVRLRVFVMLDTEDRTDPTRPWSNNWVGRRRLSSFFHRLPPVDPDGSFALTLPAIRGLHIVARASGYRPAVGQVSFSGPPPVAEPVALALDTRSIRLRGTVRKEDGEPVRNLRLDVFLVVEEEPLIRMDTMMPAGGGGFVGGRMTRSGKSLVYLGIQAHTGPRRDCSPGVFEVELTYPGEVIVYVFPEDGYASVRLELGEVTTEPEPVRITLKPAKDKGTVVLLENGRPITAKRVSIADYSLPRPSPMFRVRVGTGGVLPTALLVPGHWYLLSTSSIDGRRVDMGRQAYFVWRPSKTLELSTLPEKEPEAWKEKRR